MPFYVEKGSSDMYRSDKRLLLTADGRIVGPEDSNGVTLLVAEGGEIPYPDAIKYGLVPNPKGSQEVKSAKPEALPLPTTAEAAEKVGDVLPKSVGTETKADKAKTDKK